MSLEAAPFVRYSAPRTEQNASRSQKYRVAQFHNRTKTHLARIIPSRARMLGEGAMLLAANGKIVYELTISALLHCWVYSRVQAHLSLVEPVRHSYVMAHPVRVA